VIILATQQCSCKNLCSNTLREPLCALCDNCLVVEGETRCAWVSNLNTSLLVRPGILSTITRKLETFEQGKKGQTRYLDRMSHPLFSRRKWMRRGSVKCAHDKISSLTWFSGTKSTAQIYLLLTQFQFLIARILSSLTHRLHVWIILVYTPLRCSNFSRKCLFLKAQTQEPRRKSHACR